MTTLAAATALHGSLLAPVAERGSDARDGAARSESAGKAPRATDGRSRQPQRCAEPGCELPPRPRMGSRGPVPILCERHRQRSSTSARCKAEGCQRQRQAGREGYCKRHHHEIVERVE